MGDAAESSVIWASIASSGCLPEVHPRAPLPHLKFESGGGAEGYSVARGGCRGAAIWHFNCLAGSGRWWPGTHVVTNSLRFPTFRIINS